MKKTFLILAMVIAAIPVYAQNDWTYNRRSAATVNPGAFIVGTTYDGFGAGAAFEHALAKQFSVKANGYFLGYTPKETINYIERDTDGFTSMLMFALEARWYPLDRYVEGLFINGGLQYHLLTGTVVFYDYADEKNIRFSGAYNSLGIFSGLGYKVVFGKTRFGLALEPTIDYIWSFYSNIPHSEDAIDHSLLGMSAMGIKGFRLGLQLGVAF